MIEFSRPDHTFNHRLYHDQEGLQYQYCDFHAYKKQSTPGVLVAHLKELVAGVEAMQKEMNDAFDWEKRVADGPELQLPKIWCLKNLLFLWRGFISIEALASVPNGPGPP